MEKLIDVYAYFLLTILGFIIPIFAILLTLFHDGVAKLALQYQTERTQTEKKLTTQLQKAGGSESLDVKGIQQTIKELERVKKTADAKLSLLTPKKTILRLIIPLSIAFIGLVPNFFFSTIYSYFAGCISLLFVGYIFFQFWKLLDILVEVKSLLDAETKNDQRRIPELLAEIAGNTKKGAAYFIERIFIKFDNVLLNQESNKVALTVDKKTDVPMRLINKDPLMAKDIEAGFRFPIEFLIEKTDGYNIYANADEQIVRYSLDRLHGDTSYVLSPLVITPLKKGNYDFKIFIKGENIETKYRELTISVE